VNSCQPKQSTSELLTVAVASGYAAAVIQAQAAAQGNVRDQLLILAASSLTLVSVARSRLETPAFGLPGEGGHFRMTETGRSGHYLRIPVPLFANKTPFLPVRSLAGARQTAENRMDALYLRPAREAVGRGMGHLWVRCLTCSDESHRETPTSTGGAVNERVTSPKRARLVPQLTSRTDSLPQL
jgi:hypothetical protein